MQLTWMFVAWMIVVVPGFLQSGAVFEAATVKRSASSGHATTIRLEPGMLVIQGMSLRDLVLRAYGRGRALQLSRSDVVSGGPKWSDSELFDIEAKPGGNPSQTEDPVSERLKALLVERFHLAIHHESKEDSGYLLVLAKNGPRMKGRVEGDGGEAPTARGRRFETGFRVVRRDTSMIALADYLGFYVLDRPVVDRTGLTGRFDLDLSWNPDESQFGGWYRVEGSDQPDLVTAMREQIGLGLKAGKVPVDVIVIDRAERPLGI